MTPAARMAGTILVLILTYVVIAAAAFYGLQSTP